MNLHRCAVAALTALLISACGDAVVEPESSTAALVVADAVDPPTASPPTELLDADGNPFRPVHATLLPDGRVMMVSTGSDSIAGSMTPTPVGVAAPASVTLAREVVPVEAPGVTFGNYYVSDTLFCGGQTLMADGSIFYAGGTRLIVDTTDQSTYVLGLGSATTYNATDGWNRIENELVGTGEQGTNDRWYPAATRLADGKILVTSGRDLVLYSIAGGPLQLGTKNRSTEVFDPATSSFSLVTSHENTPEAIYNADYTHQFVLPYDSPYDTTAWGESGIPHIFSRTVAPHWFSTGDLRPDTVVGAQGEPLELPNVGVSSLVLPIRVANGEWGYFSGSLLAAGGTLNRSHERSYDVYDPIQSSWLQRNDMGSRRHHPSSVLLPTGQIVVLAGHDNIDADPMIRRAIFIDPRRGFARDDGSVDMGEVRGYHTVSVLLPDGRVLVGGGRSAGSTGPADEKPNMRYYYPPYMFAQRPAITSAPTTIGYGENVVTSWSGGNLGEAVLLALGSMTHSVDLNQRYVELEAVAVDQANKVAVLQGPRDGHVAPPGHYMLFLLDENLVPSEARIVLVQ